MPKFKVIYMDVPWKYETWDGTPGTAGDHYDTADGMSFADMPILELADPNAIMAMWTTWPHLPQALELGAALGFSYSTCLTLWAKLNKRMAGRFVMLDDPTIWFMGQGHSSRANTEPLLLFRRGVLNRKDNRTRQLLVAELPDNEIVVTPLMEHSRKPQAVMDRLMKLFDGPYLELFARRYTPGWTCLGNKLDGLDIRESLRAVINGSSLGETS